MLVRTIMRDVKRISLGILFLALTGCAVTPYESELSCPSVDPGKCMSFQSAYNQLVNDKGSNDSSLLIKEGNMTVLEPEAVQVSGESRNRKVVVVPSLEKIYRDAWLTEMTKTLRYPTTPTVVPPKIIRILITPYTDAKNNFYDARYIYEVIEDARWVLNPSVTGQIREYPGHEPAKPVLKKEKDEDEEEYEAF